MNSIVWLIILAIFILIEIITLGFKVIWFAGGAFVAFAVSLVLHNLILEIVIFLALSMALLFFVRPVVLHYFNPKNAKTNYEKKHIHT